MAENIREIVNGRQLSTFIGQEISITGTVVNVAPNGLSMSLKSHDGVDVTVKFRKPNRDLLEGVVEVLGICNSRDTVTAGEVIQFAEWDDYDTESYNKLCKFLMSAADLWKIETY